MDQSLLTIRTPLEVSAELAERVRRLRLDRNWTRDTLAERAGVTLASLRRFETTGNASLELVLKVAHALDRLHELDGLFRPARARSLAELERQSVKPERKRGRR
jgi:transcriptional regulator with XRE-family HTH domain